MDRDAREWSTRQFVRMALGAVIVWGGQLRMKWKGAGTTMGTLEGETFTLNNEGMLFM